MLLRPPDLRGLAWQRRQARAAGVLDAHCGSVSFLQRFGGAVNLNCHIHSLLPDGVFSADEQSGVRFHALPPPSDEDVAHVLDHLHLPTHPPPTRPASHPPAKPELPGWRDETFLDSPLDLG